MARTTRRFKRNIAVGGKRTRRNIRRRNTRKIGGTVTGNMETWDKIDVESPGAQKRRINACESLVPARISKECYNTCVNSEISDGPYDSAVKTYECRDHEKDEAEKRMGQATRRQAAINKKNNEKGLPAGKTWYKGMEDDSDLINYFTEGPANGADEYRKHMEEAKKVIAAAKGKKECEEAMNNSKPEDEMVKKIVANGAAWEDLIVYIKNLAEKVKKYIDFFVPAPPHPKASEPYKTRREVCLIASYYGANPTPHSKGSKTRSNMWSKANALVVEANKLKLTQPEEEDWQLLDGVRNKFNDIFNPFSPESLNRGFRPSPTGISNAPKRKGFKSTRANDERAAAWASCKEIEDDFKYLVDHISDSKLTKVIDGVKKYLDAQAFLKNCPSAVDNDAGEEEPVPVEKKEAAEDHPQKKQRAADARLSKPKSRGSQGDMILGQEEKPEWRYDYSEVEPVWSVVPASLEGMKVPTLNDAVAAGTAVVDAGTAAVAGLKTLISGDMSLKKPIPPQEGGKRKTHRVVKGGKRTTRRHKKAGKGRRTRRR